ncbi:WG repeat-containing protein [Candidatus Saccharibacteria bacterium]|nr:WG repeat-containing protein [Candidatus Saccharibacteria bacterium]
MDGPDKDQTPTIAPNVEPMPASEPVMEPAPEVTPLAPQPTTTETKPPKKASKLRVIVLAVVSSAVVVTVAVIVVIQLLNIVGPFGGKESLYDHNAYFVPESSKTNTKYALVDKNGKELTEYNIEKFDEFIDGYTIVKTTDGWGIINDAGRMTVKPNEYDALSRVGGLYTALKPGSAERKLLHGSGREVTSYSSSLNSNLGSDNYYGSKNAFAVAIKRADKQYDIYNARGKKITSIESDEAPVISSVVSDYEISSTITSISYSGGLIVFRNDNLEEIVNTKDSNKVYQILYTSIDGTQMVFSEIEKRSDDEKENLDDYIPSYSRYAENVNRAIITGGKFREIGDKCRSISIIDSEEVPTGYISCNSTEDGNGFYSSDGVFHKLYDTATYASYIVIDADHYATQRYSGGTSVAINGRNISQATSITKMKSNFVVSVSGGQKQIYDKSGSKICTLNSSSTFNGFDKNGLATVYSREISSGSSYSYNYHLINQKCTSISNTYASISSVGKYYIATKRTSSNTSPYDESRVYLLNTSGKVQMDDENISTISRASYRGKAKDMLVVRKSDGKNTLYNEKLEKIIDFEGSILYDNNQDMVKIYGEKFINFYTPDGTELRSVPAGEGARSQT